LKLHGGKIAVSTDDQRVFPQSRCDCGIIYIFQQSRDTVTAAHRQHDIGISQRCQLIDIVKPRGIITGKTLKTPGNYGLIPHRMSGFGEPCNAASRCLLRDAVAGRSDKMDAGHGNSLLIYYMDWL